MILTILNLGNFQLAGRGRGRPAKHGKVGRPRKSSKLSLKSGRLVVDKEESEEEMEVTPGDDPESPTECTLCGKVFSSTGILARHMETHGQHVEELKCNICEKPYLSEEDLNKHKKLHKTVKKSTRSRRKVRKPSKKIRFHCAHCSRVFKTEQNKDDHEITHTIAKPFECDICGSFFRLKSNLATHKKVIHFDEKRYKCQLCDKEFKYKKVLKGHTMSVHTGERPYKCEFCEAGFVYLQHYKKHMRIHTGEKPYTCLICDKAFNSSDNRRAHMFTHSDVKPYECLLCGAGFMRRPLVLAHIKQHPHIQNIEASVKVNSPTTLMSKMGTNTGGVKNPGGTGVIRKRKVNREHTQSGVMQAHQSQSSQNNLEDTVHQYVLPHENREASTSGEAFSYMLGHFPAPGQATHYAPLNLGQW